MEFLRSQPNLCSLFLSLLEEWGAETLDWSLLRDEAFVDRFLRRLMVSQSMDDPEVFQACHALLQPSAGGLLVAPLLVRGGHFEASEMDSFVQFAVMGKAYAWDPMTWPELLTVLEEVAFTRRESPARFLAAMLANGWVPPALKERFIRRIWETSRLSIREKNFFFAWMSGESRWADIPPVEGMNLESTRKRSAQDAAVATPVCSVRLHTSRPLRSGNLFGERRRGISTAGKEATG